jgi:hypothetical protein
VHRSNKNYILGQTSPRPELAINDNNHENAQTNIPTTSILTSSTGMNDLYLFKY